MYTETHHGFLLAKKNSDTASRGLLVGQRSSSHCAAGACATAFIMAACLWKAVRIFSLTLAVLLAAHCDDDVDVIVIKPKYSEELEIQKRPPLQVNRLCM